MASFLFTCRNCLELHRLAGIDDREVQAPDDFDFICEICRPLLAAAEPEPKQEEKAEEPVKAKGKAKK
jgi:hypothetical protein